MKRRTKADIKAGKCIQETTEKAFKILMENRNKRKLFLKR